MGVRVGSHARQDATDGVESALQDTVGQAERWAKTVFYSHETQPKIGCVRRHHWNPFRNHNRLDCQDHLVDQPLPRERGVELRATSEQNSVPPGPREKCNSFLWRRRPDRTRLGGEHAILRHHDDWQLRKMTAYGLFEELVGYAAPNDAVTGANELEKHLPISLRQEVFRLILASRHPV